MMKRYYRFGIVCVLPSWQFTPSRFGERGYLWQFTPSRFGERGYLWQFTPSRFGERGYLWQFAPSQFGRRGYLWKFALNRVGQGFIYATEIRVFHETTCCRVGYVVAGDGMCIYSQHVVTFCLLYWQIGLGVQLYI